MQATPIKPTSPSILVALQNLSSMSCRHLSDALPATVRKFVFFDIEESQLINLHEFSPNETEISYVYFSRYDATFTRCVINPSKNIDIVHANETFFNIFFRRAIFPFSLFFRALPGHLL